MPALGERGSRQLLAPCRSDHQAPSDTPRSGHTQNAPGQKGSRGVAFPYPELDTVVLAKQCPTKLQACHSPLVRGHHVSRRAQRWCALCRRRASCLYGRPSSPKSASENSCHTSRRPARLDGSCPDGSTAPRPACGRSLQRARLRPSLRAQSVELLSERTESAGHLVCPRLRHSLVELGHRPSDRSVSHIFILSSCRWCSLMRDPTSHRSRLYTRW